MKKNERSVWKIVSAFIRQAKCGSGVVCVLAPWFVPAREGYLQRVAAIDAEVLAPHYCVHLDFETGCSEPCISRKDERHLLVELVPHEADSLRLAMRIARACGVMYIHSVMRAMQDIMGENIDRLFRMRGVTRIWDVHGAVPEEYVMQPNFFEAQNATHAEELLLEQADVMVTISESMQRHFLNKYGKVPSTVINTSVFNVTQVDTPMLVEKKSAEQTKFIATYAGNLMPWQNIPLLQQLMRQAGDRYDYRIFTPQPQKFSTMAGAQPLPQHTVQCVNPQQVLESHCDCHFGFVLRDDSAVNRVACPTKMMEYIQFGLIPVLKSADIGDFKELGLRYIPWEKFAQLELSAEQYSEIALHNYTLLARLDAIHTKGIAELKVLVRQLVQKRGCHI